MNITISDPTPAPEMPVMWAVASPCGNTQCNWALMSWGHLEKSARDDHARTPGSRLIRIDPNAPSFEPGPTEWVDKGTGRTIRVRVVDGLLDIETLMGAKVMGAVHLPRACLVPLIQALITEDAARKGKG